jgi:hypothetical protein
MRKTSWKNFSLRITSKLKTKTQNLSMTERLLQFIWQFQYFNKNELSTVAGEGLEIISSGQYNTNQGPDFSNARIRIGNTVWCGTVELHIHTSDWKKHRHQSDHNYKNVVLHVVWEDDGDVNDIPILELKSRVAKVLLKRYTELMESSSFIACERSIHTVPELNWKSWKERLLAERLLRKAGMVEEYLKQNSYHWEETCWWLLARNFGTTVNADAFEAIARSIPVSVLAKQKFQLHRLEALLLGQGGLLNREFEEDYPRLLRKEYHFQQRKHQLKPTELPLHFLRMRPGNFPTVRLAQLAMLVHTSSHLFAKIKETISVKDVKAWFDVTANDYWHYHYRLDEPSVFRKKKLGSAMIDNIIINTLAPILFAFGNYQHEPRYMNRALQWLEETTGEKNAVIEGFIKLGIENKSGYDSQGLLELKTQYCDKKRCLDCGVGNFLLRTPKDVR